MIRADAIVLLGCTITPQGQLSGAAARRVSAAARAFHAGVAPLVIASGGRRWGAVVEARALHRALVEAGVPEAPILDELCSFSTCDNALFSTALLRHRTGNPSPRAAIVTCPWHMPRAMELFRAAGAEPVAVPADPAAATLSQQAYRFGHELVCRVRDARLLRRSTLLAQSAAAYLQDPPRGVSPGEPS
ncbi:MAG: YdcF family protein [Byssovorax sp.]